MTENETPVPDPLAGLVADDSAAPTASAEVRATVEALIFASPEPITPKRLCRLLSEEPKETHPIDQAVLEGAPECGNETTMAVKAELPDRAVADEKQLSAEAS